MYTVEMRALVEMIPVKRAVLVGCSGLQCLKKHSAPTQHLFGYIRAFDL